MWQEILKDSIALFVIVSPLGAVPLFLAMTANDPLPHRRRTSIYAAVTTTVTLAGAALAGEAVFRFLGITLDAFRIAGGILLFLYGMDMVQMKRPRMKTTDEEVDEGMARAEVGIVPLGIPMLAGPGAIATVMVLQAHGRDQRIDFWALMIAVLIIGIVTLVVLLLAARLDRWLSPVVMGIITRLEGLLLASLAVQMTVSGLVRLYQSVGSGA